MSEDLLNSAKPVVRCVRCGRKTDRVLKAGKADAGFPLSHVQVVTKENYKTALEGFELRVLIGAMNLHGKEQEAPICSQSCAKQFLDAAYEAAKKKFLDLFFPVPSVGIVVANREN